MIAAMYATGSTATGILAAPGSNLMLADIDVELAEIRARKAQYRAERAPDAERIDRMVAELLQSAASGGGLCSIAMPRTTCLSLALHRTRQTGRVSWREKVCKYG